MFNYVSGVCGSGKTTKAIEVIAERYKNGETVIYATGTIKLLNQTKDGLEALGVHVEIIVATEADYTRKRNTSVTDRLLSRVVAEESPRVILCIIKSLICIAKSIPQNKRMPLYIDEEFTVLDSGFYVATTENEIKGILYRLGLEETQPQGYISKPEYKYPQGIVPLSEYENCPLYCVEYAISGSKLEWIASLDIKPFSKCFTEIITLSACYEDTMQYYAIKASGVSQVCLDWGLETEHYSNGVVHVSYVLTKREWRSTFVKTLSDEQLENINLEFERTGWFGEYLSVKSIGGSSMVVDLKVKAHGFNNYQDSNEVINLHTQMPTNYVESFIINNYKMTKGEVRRAYYQYGCYQAAMRISLRKSTRQCPIKHDVYLCFGDKGTAEYFIGKLDESVNFELSQLEVGLDLDFKKSRKDKVSDNPQEVKNRSKDRKELSKMRGDLAAILEMLIVLRDWRKENPKRRVTKKLYTQLAGEYL